MQILTENQPPNELPGGLCTDGAKQEVIVSHDGSGQELNNPASFAKRFVAHRKASVEEEVSSTVVLSEGMTAFATDETLMKEFIRELANAKVLTKAEAAEGESLKKSDSMISRLKKIKQNAKVILHPKILPYVQTGYSVLYEMALLYEEIEDIRGIEDADAAIAKLHDLLANSDGPATRDWLKKKRENLRSLRVPKDKAGAKNTKAKPPKSDGSKPEAAALPKQQDQPENPPSAAAESVEVKNRSDSDEAPNAPADSPKQLTEVLAGVLKAVTGDVLIIEGNRSSLLSIRTSLLKRRIEPGNIHLFAKSGAKGWVIDEGDRQAGAESN